MKYLIRTCGPIVEIQHLMGGLTKEEAYSFQLIDKILQLPITRRFTSDILGESLDKEPTGNRIEVEESNMTTCTALIPAESSNVMDIQALEAIKQINRDDGVLKKAAHQRAIASIKATTRDICIEGALNILDAFGYENTVFYCRKQKWRACDLGKEKYFPDLQGRFASETPLFWFWGGPPVKLKWYQGTLQTLLNDRVMYEISQQGAARIAEMIGTDLEGLSTSIAPTR